MASEVNDDQQSSVMAIEVTKVSTQSPTWILLLLTYIEESHALSFCRFVVGRNDFRSRCNLA